MELLQRTTPGISSPQTVLTKQQQIAKLTKQAPHMAMNVSHHMDVAWFQEVFRRPRKDGATGLDGVSGTDYAKDLWVNLQSLIDRVKSGTYSAPPVKRVYILKEDGRERPCTQRKRA